MNSDIFLKKNCATIPQYIIVFFLLSVCPGNAAVVKPSEVCVHTAKVMEDLLPLYIDKVCLSVAQYKDL